LSLCTLWRTGGIVPLNLILGARWM